MWVNEKIFSIGDLADDEMYYKEIDFDYVGRYEHIKEMIKSLEVEKEFLEKEMDVI